MLTLWKICTAVVRDSTMKWFARTDKFYAFCADARTKILSFLTCTLVVLVWIFSASPTRADDVPTGPLMLGYEEEGKVDASPHGCAKYVKNEVEWSKSDTARGIRNVCAARRSHVHAYQALQNKYKSFLEAIDKDKRLNVTAAVTNLKALFKACMDHKWNLTTGGHNIGIDITTNKIAAACLTLGAKLLKDESTQLKGRQGV